MSLYAKAMQTARDRIGSSLLQNDNMNMESNYDTLNLVDTCCFLFSPHDPLNMSHSTNVDSVPLSGWIYTSSNLWTHATALQVTSASRHDHRNIEAS